MLSVVAKRGPAPPVQKDPEQAWLPLADSVPAAALVAALGAAPAAVLAVVLAVAAQLGREPFGLQERRRLCWFSLCRELVAE